MTTAQLAQAIGKQGILRIGNLKVRIVVNDARQVFDRVDYQVVPADGSGVEWVSADRVRLVGE